MCVVAAIKLPIGPSNEPRWVVLKNRDRAYVPIIKIKKNTFKKTEYRNFIDKDTSWAEGVNSRGIAIVNSALLTYEDEIQNSDKAKDKHKSKIMTKLSHDGFFIKKALRSKKILDAVSSIVTNKVYGHSLVTDGESLYVIENVRTKEHNNAAVTTGEMIKWSKVDDDKDFIVRTNHGDAFPETGYQEDDKAGKSSRLRKKYVEDAFKKNKPTTIAEAFECMSVQPDKNPEFNPIRLKSKGCKIFTTGQYLINPETKSFYYKPVDCKFEYRGEIVKDPKEINDFISDKTSFFIINEDTELNERISFSRLIKLYEDISVKK